VQPGRERLDEHRGDGIGDRGEHRDRGVRQGAGIVAQGRGPDGEVLGADLTDLATNLVVIAVVEFALYSDRQRARGGLSAGDGLPADQAAAAGGADHDLVRGAEDADLDLQGPYGMATAVEGRLVGRL
jgi:hypothetical protein